MKTRVVEDPQTHRKVVMSAQAQISLGKDKVDPFIKNVLAFLKAANVAYAYVGKAWDGVYIELHGIGLGPAGW